MKKWFYCFLVVVVLGICLTGCQANKSIEGEWERADAASPLYGMVVKIEKSSDGSYVGKIISLTGVAKENGFKTGGTKWSSMKPTNEANQYFIKDLTINALDGEKSWTDMILEFDPKNPDEIKIASVEKTTNWFGSNSQTYRRK